jgi:hypothetical protein
MGKLFKREGKRMTILYEGFDGKPSMPILGWVVVGLGILMIITVIWFLITKDIEGIGALLGIGIVLVIGGLVLTSDTRIPIVKATINEEICWQEINDKYELIEQQNQLYIFKVKNTTVEEWENHLKEKENKK